MTCDGKIEHDGMMLYCQRRKNHKGMCEASFKISWHKDRDKALAELKEVD